MKSGLQQMAYAHLLTFCCFLPRFFASPIYSWQK
jgi:hypothetical protein